MAGKLIFSIAGVRQLIASAQAATERRVTFGQLFDPELRKDGKEPDAGTWPTEADIDPAKVPPALWLVKDQGVYLMSNAKLAEGEKPAVVYAEGLDPNKAKFDDWYYAAEDICGGDDFAEALPIAGLPSDGQQFGYLVVTMSRDSLMLEMSA